MWARIDIGSFYSSINPTRSVTLYLFSNAASFIIVQHCNSVSRLYVLYSRSYHAIGEMATVKFPVATPGKELGSINTVRFPQ